MSCWAAVLLLVKTTWLRIMAAINSFIYLDLCCCDSTFPLKEQNLHWWEVWDWIGFFRKRFWFIHLLFIIIYYSWFIKLATFHHFDLFCHPCFQQKLLWLIVLTQKSILNQTVDPKIWVKLKCGAVKCCQLYRLVKQHQRNLPGSVGPADEPSPLSSSGSASPPKCELLLLG